jgi:hypothetical protein
MVCCVHGSVHRKNILMYISNKMQRYTVHFIWKLLYIARVVKSPIIRSANNCIYSIWYLSHRYCYLPLSWKRWNRFECAVGGLIRTISSGNGNRARNPTNTAWTTVPVCPSIVGSSPNDFLFRHWITLCYVHAQLISIQFDYRIT